MLESYETVDFKTIQQHTRTSLDCNMFRFPSPAHNNTDHQHHRSSPPQVTNSSRVNTETPTMKCESEEPSSSTADQNDFPLPNSFSCSQRKSHQRTKAMWDAAVSAINAYLQTDEDYVTSEEKKAFSSTIEQLRISAERLVSTLQQPLSPTHGHTDENLDQSREIEKPGHEESVSEERMVDLEWALEQERRKRKHLQEDFETFRSNMANVLTEHAQDIAELRSSLVPQKRKAVSSRTVSAAYTAVESTDLDTANPEPHRLKRLNIEGLNLDSFSWDLTLDRTQLIDPADGFVYLLPDVRTTCSDY